MTTLKQQLRNQAQGGEHVTYLREETWFGQPVLLDLGRHWRAYGLHDSSGVARVYMGEAYEVMKLVLQHTKRGDDD